MNFVLNTIVSLLVVFFVNNSFAAVLKGRLVITGSSTVAPLASEIAKKFEKLNPEVRIDVQTGGSSRGVSDAKSGLADIGMVSRGLKGSESKLFNFEIAKDGIGIILNKKNKVKFLTNEQVVAIFTGKIKNWKSLGGDDAPITVINKAAGRSTLELFLKYYKIKHSKIKAHIIIGDNEQGIKFVSGDANAISYVSIGAAEYSIRAGIALKLIPNTSVKASLENVTAGRFPLSRPLNLITKNKPMGLSKAFIDFAKSNQVNEIIRRQYFAPATRR